jgi:maleate isomerase
MNKNTLKIQFDDGPHPRAQLGFIAVANADLTEADMFRMKPQDVGVHFTRVKMEKECTVSSLSKMGEMLENAIGSLMPGRTDLDVVCYNCTAGSFVIGEDNIIKTIQDQYSDVKGTTLLTGVVNALRALNVKKIVMATAYTDDINHLEKEYFEQKGFDVLDIKGLGLMTDMEMNRVTLETLKNFAVSLDQPEAQAIFMSCGALRSLEIIQQVEAATGKPFIGSNHASMWHCLRLAGIKDHFDGFGELFRTC